MALIDKIKDTSGGVLGQSPRHEWHGAQQKQGDAPSGHYSFGPSIFRLIDYSGWQYRCHFGDACLSYENEWEGQIVCLPLKD